MAISCIDFDAVKTNSKYTTIRYSLVKFKYSRTINSCYRIIVICYSLSVTCDMFESNIFSSEIWKIFKYFVKQICFGLKFVLTIFSSKAWPKSFLNLKPLYPKRFHPKIRFPPKNWVQHFFDSISFQLEIFLWCTFSFTLCFNNNFWPTFLLSTKCFLTKNFVSKFFFDPNCFWAWLFWD